MMKKIPAALAALLVAGLLTTQAFASFAPGGPKSCPAGFPFGIHVGWVTAYTPGSSITIEGHDGTFSTYALSGSPKILPSGRAGELTLGTRVTILASRDPSTCGWNAFGIVVHPAGSGAGSAPPTATPTMTASPTDTLTPTVVPSDTPTDTAVPSDTPTP
jgi:hypothetical protein